MSFTNKQGHSVPCIVANALQQSPHYQEKTKVARHYLPSMLAHFAGYKELQSEINVFVATSQESITAEQINELGSLGAKLFEFKQHLRPKYTENGIAKF